MTSLNVLQEALQSSTSAWKGCDWDTDFGSRRANLRGLCSRQARLAAQATRGDESAYWREVCRFLENVEQDARAAAELAGQAVEIWRLGNFTEGLRRMRRGDRYRSSLSGAGRLPKITRHHATTRILLHWAWQRSCRCWLALCHSCRRQRLVA